MRARTHSLAFLPATSTVATVALALTWWLTVFGLTAPTAPDLGLVLVSAAAAAAVVTVAADPQVRSALASWVLRTITPGRQVFPPGVTDRWARADRSARAVRTLELALVRVALPRAPGQGSATA